MAQVKTNGVNGTTKHTPSRTSFVATGKEYGNRSGSRSYRRSQSIDTQDHLATQFPARSPSRDSIASQDGDIGGYSAASFGSQEGLATQFHPSNSRQNFLGAAHSEPSVSNNVHNRRLLLGLIDKGNRQKHLPEQQSKQSQRSGGDSAPRSTKQTPTPDLGTSTMSNNVQDERSLPENVINGSRQRPSSEQQLRSRTSSPDSSTSSDLITNDEPDDQGDDVMMASQSRKARNSSQGQRRRSISEARSSQRPKPSSKKSSKRMEMNPQHEVTSFQVQFSSSSENPAPMAENGDNHVNRPGERSDANRTRSTETAQKEKSSRHDPWSNMQRLCRRDVVIPQEQEELLDRLDCWIPPDVGQPYPQGHVPPTLLQEWNGKMIRLFSDARRTHASSQKKAEPSQEQEDDPQPSSKPLSDNEDDANSEVTWSESESSRESSPENLQKDEAPPDSSPIQQNNERRPAGIAERKMNGTANPVNEEGRKSKTGTPQPVSPIRQQIETSQGTNLSIHNNQGHNSNLSIEPHSAVQIPSGNHRSQDEASELGDDSDMDMTVPEALLVRSQDISSQIVFSGPIAPDSSNLNSAPAGRVQILNTPAAALKRAAVKRAENALIHSQEWVAQQSSSGSNKSSSQLIANSLDSTEGSSGQEGQLQDAQRPLVADSQVTNGDLQSSSHSSHQDSQRLLEVIPDSSFQSVGLHTQVSLQRHESSKERVENDPNPSTPMVNGNQLKRKAAELEDQATEKSPSKRTRKLPDRTMDTSRTQIVVDVDHETVNRGSHEDPSLYKDALRMYDMFKRSYPKYAGDFYHFQTLCHDLQLLNRRGILQNSSLWDDFIMRHWVDYGTHVQKCISSSEECESYEDFFCKNFTKPSFRKRNLTPRILDIVVSSRLTSSIQKSTAVERGMQTIDDNSVSASVIHRAPLVVDQGPKSMLEKPNTQSTTSDVIVVADRPHQANIGVKLSAPSASPKKRSIIVGSGIQVNLEPPTPSSHGLNGRPEHVEDENRAVEETPPPGIITDVEHIAHNERDNTPEEFINDYHDTASIELGLELMEQVLNSHRDDEDGNDPNNVEARFDQISRMRRDDAQAIQALITTEVPPPPEEEDASTPFKTWARDDHNIVSERHRRGGYKVPLDKNGNIVVEKFPRVIDEEEVVPPLSRWIWPRRSRNNT